MRNHFRLAKLAAASAMVLGAPVTAFAAPVTLTFEQPTVAPGGAVGNAYNTPGIGIAFTGANTVVDGSGLLFPPPAPGVQFVVSGTSFVLDVLDPAATPFDILRLDFTGPLEVRIQDNQGSAPITVLADRQDFWKTDMAPFALDRTRFGLIDSITFTFNPTTGFQGFGIDNVRLDLQPTAPPPPPPPPGPTPPPAPSPVSEPAGTALAALALLGAGLASRRRRED